MPQQSKHDFFQSEYLRVEEFSSEVEKLQDVLYCHSRDILSAEDVHVLRHVLRAERTGPLKAGEPAVWWSPAQENRFFTTLAERRVRGALNPDEEPIQLLLQLLSASLTPPQRQHLAALLGVPHSQRASHQPPTILSTEHTAVPTPGQMRTMALLQRVLEGETLSPVENGLLQEGILRELLQLLPCEDVQVLYSLVLSSDPIPVRRYGVPILEELQSARALWESGGNIMGYVRQIGSSGLRQLFIYCLAASLTFQQRKIISQLLGENPEKQKPDEEQEGSQDTSAGMQPGVYPANCPLHGEAVGDRATEDPKARCGRDKEVCSAAKVAGGGPADLQMEPMIALTREQAGFTGRRRASRRAQQVQVFRASF
ncbi:uncharacterized protein EMH_0072640 [Eimeria mitis]|uniref:Uncharacterized protein n=1 Tax=Eimeria mitis TaxID=44415 RepID=U6K543_9EIME|nr:uncharacterized protein EMH_0072640 [Eimeria mitis]CDJ32126.1 hypothetical protein EMH_0072640 [Eimeria mitis]